MIVKDSNGKSIRITADQARILLVLCNEAESAARHGFQSPGVRLIVTHGPNPIRETSIGAALARKGFAERLYNGRWRATTEGYWQGDTLRIAKRLSDRRDR